MGNVDVLYAETCIKRFEIFSIRVPSCHWCDRVSECKEYKEGNRGRLLPMQHDDSRPSYLLAGLVATSQLRELLDEVYFYPL